MAEKLPYQRLAGGELILYLYEKTKNGQAFPLNSSLYPVDELRINWTKTAALQFAVTVDQLIWDLNGIAALWKQLGNTPEENAALLTPSQLEIWNLFLRPLIPENMDHAQYLRIQQKKADNTPLSKGEETFLELYKMEQIHEMTKRLPRGGIHPWLLQQRIYRYTRIVSLNAPNIIVHNEKKQLTLHLLLYYWSPIET